MSLIHCNFDMGTVPDRECLIRNRSGGDWLHEWEDYQTQPFETEAPLPLFLDLHSFCQYASSYLMDLLMCDPWQLLHHGEAQIQTTSCLLVRPHVIHFHLSDRLWRGIITATVTIRSTIPEAIIQASCYSGESRTTAGQGVFPRAHRPSSALRFDIGKETSPNKRSGRENSSHNEKMCC
jgi:hypothetical protein